MAHRQEIIRIMERWKELPKRIRVLWTHMGICWVEAAPCEMNLLLQRHRWTASDVTISNNYLFFHEQDILINWSTHHTAPMYQDQSKVQVCQSWYILKASSHCLVAYLGTRLHEQRLDVLKASNSSLGSQLLAKSAALILGRAAGFTYYHPLLCLQINTYKLHSVSRP